MIITVQGTYESNNNSTGICAALASLTALKRQKRTLVIQLINQSDKTVDNLLIGKKLKEQKIYSGISIDDFNKGIDSVFRNISSMRADEEFFFNSVNDIFSNHMLDILAVSNKTDFEKEIILRLAEYSELIEGAKKVYEYIYVLLPSKNKELCEKIVEYADMNLICVQQGPYQQHLKSDKNLFIVADYENESMYTPQFFRKSYHIKKIYGQLHNTGYKDALSSQTLLPFFSKNISNDKNDDNAVFINCLMELVDKIVVPDVAPATSNLNNDELPPETSLEEIPSEEINSSATLSEIPVVKKEKQAGFFRKRSAKKSVATVSSANEIVAEEPSCKETIMEMDLAPQDEIPQLTAQELAEQKNKERENKVNEFIELLYSNYELTNSAVKTVEYQKCFIRTYVEYCLTKNENYDSTELLASTKGYFLSKDLQKSILRLQKLKNVNPANMTCIKAYQNLDKYFKTVIVNDFSYFLVMADLPMKKE